MPLFHRDSVSLSSRSSIEEPNTHRTTHKSGGLFGHRNSTSTSSTGYSSSSASGSRHGTTHGHGHSHGLFHKRTEDPAITAARDRVYRAEEAERAADKALYNANSGAPGNQQERQPTASRRRSNIVSNAR